MCEILAVGEGRRAPNPRVMRALARPLALSGALSTTLATRIPTTIGRTYAFAWKERPTHRWLDVARLTHERYMRLGTRLRADATAGLCRALFMADHTRLFAEWGTGLAAR